MTLKMSKNQSESLQLYQNIRRCFAPYLFSCFSIWRLMLSASSSNHQAWQQCWSFTCELVLFAGLRKNWFVFLFFFFKHSRSVYSFLCPGHSFNAYKHVHVPGRFDGLHAEKVQNRLDIYSGLFRLVLSISDMDNGIWPACFKFYLCWNHVKFAAFLGFEMG